jgi:hypothetical protein
MGVDSALEAHDFGGIPWAGRIMPRLAAERRAVLHLCVRSADEDAIWVTEVWDTEASHKASLSLPSVQQTIAQGRPLIASFSERFETIPVGGHGLVAEQKP